MNYQKRLLEMSWKKIIWKDWEPWFRPVHFVLSLMAGRTDFQFLLFGVLVLVLSVSQCRHSCFFGACAALRVRWPVFWTALSGVANTLCESWQWHTLVPLCPAVHLRFVFSDSFWRTICPSMFLCVLLIVFFCFFYWLFFLQSDNGYESVYSVCKQLL